MEVREHKRRRREREGLDCGSDDIKERNTVAKLGNLVG